MGTIGRNMRIMQGIGSPVLIAGARTDNLTIAHEPVDITSKDDDGWRTLLADVGVSSVTADAECVLKNDVLLAVLMARTALLEQLEITIDGLGTFAGDFMMTNGQLGAPMAEAIRLNVTFESSGVITWTPV